MAAIDYALKADKGKPKPTLLEKDCVNALESVQAVLDYGAQKYIPRSWQDIDIERYDDAARRHRISRDKGETHDEESGLPHLAHEITNLIFQLQMLISSVDNYKSHTDYKNPPQDHKT